MIVCCGIMIVRLWVEINNRVNYSVKGALIHMESDDTIDIS